jgi:ABC-type lipoprotein export system ATPase subunit
MAALIELAGVERSVAHGGRRAAREWLLRQVDLTVDEGEFLSVMGPSGSGKTTLLNILGMLDGEFEGEYRFAGTAVRALKPAARAALARANIGFIFQQYHLLEDLTVAENLEAPLTYRDVPPGERSARVGEALDRFDIVGKKDLYPSQLSGGQQQLVAVARAVVSRPRLILADEPTGALHSSQGRMIMDLLVELNAAGTTLVQGTHHEGHAARGSRVVQLRDGWLEAG